MKPRDVVFVDPGQLLREQAASILKLRRRLEREVATRKTAVNRGRAAVARRERRLVATGERSFEAPWSDPVESHPRLNPEDGFAIRISDETIRLQQRRRGRKLRAAFWATLGAPPICEPGDRMAAAIYHRRVVGALEQGGWSHNEQTTLASMERIWGRRARGEDIRFMIAGNRTGRLPKNVELRIRALTVREG